MWLPFLTSSGSPRNHRRTATCWMTALLIVGAWSVEAGAQERPPSSLIERALRRCAYCNSPRPRLATYAHWVPELHLRGIVQQSQAPGRASVENIAMAELAWPLDRPFEASERAVDVAARQRSAAREALVDRLVDTWQQRERARARGDELDVEELEAELDALSGEVER